MKNWNKTFIITFVFFASLIGVMSIWYALFVKKYHTILEYDNFINNIIANLHKNNDINSFFIFITEVFNPKIFVLWFLFLLFFLIQRKMRYEALFLFFGVSGGQVIKIILKFLTERSRPENPFYLYVHESGFPSGHATTSVFLFLSLWYLFARKYKLLTKTIITSLCIVLGIIVPFSRIFVQVHYFSDVIAGCFLGILSFAFTILFFEFCKEKRLC